MSCGAKLWAGVAMLWILWTPTTAEANDDYAVLHEVIRHFQVAFVDRPNLSALLLGGLNGIKQVAPKFNIEVVGAPNVFRVGKGNGAFVVGSQAIRDFVLLEKTLVQAARLARKQSRIKNQQKIEHAMIRGLVNACGDPWSLFLNADLYERLLDDGSGKNGSVGLLLEHHQGGLRVLDVTPSSPAEKAGILAGEEVNTIAGRAAKNLNELEGLALLRGKMGQQVKVVIAGKTQTLAFAPDPKRNLSVDKPQDGIARVHLANFRPGTGKRLASVMRKLQSMGLRALILDLRGNPGGLVTEATEVVQMFINPGKVVSVISKQHALTEVEQSRIAGAYRELPMVLLVDHRSASVSEIVALALRDYGRARLVGSKTLGKGTVQVVMELIDGSALKLSTGRYYSPLGTPLFEGIEPDVEVEWDGKGKDLPLQRAKKMLSS